MPALEDRLDGSVDLDAGARSDGAYYYLGPGDHPLRAAAARRADGFYPVVGWRFGQGHAASAVFAITERVGVRGAARDRVPRSRRTGGAVEFCGSARDCV
ncbi:hypothetical protein [Cryptosporangium japonicum]|uniref:Uncharacterized protein n=1 Tax=Cryptosporangium japonicum TaxID=80872 RepID=A0ABN0UET2_9ACTN